MPQNDTTGQLQINVTSEDSSYPVADATVAISYTGVPENQLESLTTNSSGQTEIIDLQTPPLEYSLNPTIEQQPYSEYTIQVTAPGFEPLTVAGAELLPTILAIQNISMRPLPDTSGKAEDFLFGNY